MDKGALVVATIFSILSTLIVLVLEFFWCRVSCCECCAQSEYEDLERNEIEVKLNKKNINYNESKDSKVAQRSASFE